jgi:hypothetical protein
MVYVLDFPRRKSESADRPLTGHPELGVIRGHFPAVGRQVPTIQSMVFGVS